jgi:hypothetical protein
MTVNVDIAGLMHVPPCSLVEIFGCFERILLLPSTGHDPQNLATGFSKL